MKRAVNIKRVLSLLLTTMMILSLSSFDVFAQENPLVAETSVEARATTHWQAGNTYTSEYTFNNNNLTPYKVLHSGSYIFLTGEFRRADSSNSQIQLTVQIRDYDTGEILSSQVIKDLHNDGATSTSFIGGFANVYPGRRIQIFVDASSISNPPGFYRSAWVKYNIYVGN